jgi:hypothetical protein
MKTTRKRILALGLAATTSLTQMAAAELGPEADAYDVIALECLAPNQNQDAASPALEAAMAAFQTETSNWRRCPAFQPFMDARNSALADFPHFVISLLMQTQLLRSRLGLLGEFLAETDGADEAETDGADQSKEELIRRCLAALQAAKDLPRALEVFTPRTQKLYKQIAGFGEIAANIIRVIFPASDATEGAKADFLAAARKAALTLATDGDASMQRLLALPVAGNTNANVRRWLRELTTTTLEVPTLADALIMLFLDESERTGIPASQALDHIKSGTSSALVLGFLLPQRHPGSAAFRDIDQKKRPVSCSRKPSHHLRAGL